MYAQLPLVEDTEEEILKVMYKFPKAWEFDFQERSATERVMRGLFQSSFDANDKCWRNIAKLQKIS
jgi:hypothetical protein